MKSSLRRDVLFEMAASIYVTSVVVLFWEHPAAASAAMAGGLVGQVLYWRGASDLATLLAAALLGTPAEIACVKFGIWTYYAPGLIWGIPVWIPLVWAFLFVLFRRMSMTLDMILEKRPRLDAAVYWAAAILILVYGLTTIVLISRFIAIWFSVFFIPAVFFWRGRRDVLIFVTAGFFGTLGEFICMKLGFWQYHFPMIKSLGLPLSLPLAWGLSGVIIGRIALIWERTGSAAWAENERPGRAG